MEWETVWIDLTTGQNKTPEYLAINPVGKVPTLVDGDVVVADSTIINEYLEERFPTHPLLPKDPSTKARARWFEDYGDAYLAPAVIRTVREWRKPQAERDSEREKQLLEELNRHLAYLDRELQGRRFFSGMFSLADISVSCFLGYYELGGGKVDSGYANLSRWWEAMKERESLRLSMPPEDSQADAAGHRSA